MAIELCAVDMPMGLSLLMRKGTVRPSPKANGTDHLRASPRESASSIPVLSFLGVPRWWNMWPRNVRWTKPFPLHIYFSQSVLSPQQNGTFTIIIWSLCLHYSSAGFIDMHHYTVVYSTEDQTQDCLCARQQLYQLSFIPSHQILEFSGEQQ